MQQMRFSLHAQVISGTVTGAWVGILNQILLILGLNSSNFMCAELLFIKYIILSENLVQEISQLVYQHFKHNLAEEQFVLFQV